MKFIIVLAFLCVIGAMAAVSSYRPTGSLDEEWEKFKTNYNKSYKDAEEEQHRKGIFEKHYHDIKSHNEEYDAGKVTYSKGINHLTDLEYKELPMGLLKSKDQNKS